jgi:hypoxanthine phosphoribosyltransferase
VDANDLGADLERVLLEEDKIIARIAELAEQIDRDYADRDLLLVGILKGAVMVMADLARALHRPLEMDWMAVSSYGSGAKSSGVVRILKDLDKDIGGRDVLLVEDILDSGLTLSWLLRNLASRRPASLEVSRCCASPTPPRWRFDPGTSVSTSRTNSWWATASTTPSATGICGPSGPSHPMCMAVLPEVGNSQVVVVVVLGRRAIEVRGVAFLSQRTA